jgi:hypothetical protein
MVSAPKAAKETSTPDRIGTDTADMIILLGIGRERTIVINAVAAYHAFPLEAPLGYGSDKISIGSAPKKAALWQNEDDEPKSDR